MMAAGKLKRYCETCMSETEWEEESVVAARSGRHEVVLATPPPEPAAAAATPAEAAPPPPAATPQPQPEASLTEQLLHAGQPVPERRASKRIFIKTRARIRRASSAEIVEPINVSRGGICFQSRASYELDEVVWVAMHYRDGDSHPMETTSRVVRISRGAPNQPPAYGISFQV